MRAMFPLLTLLAACAGADPSADDTAGPTDSGDTDTSGGDTEVIATGFFGPLSHDDTHVYFLGSSGDVTTWTISRAPLAGGEVETVIAPGAQVLWHAAVGGQVWYATLSGSDGLLWRVPATGGEAVEIGTLLLHAKDHFSYDDQAFYAMMGDGLHRFEPDGTSTNLGMGPQYAPHASDGDHLYMTGAETSVYGPISRMPATGGAVETLVEEAGMTTLYLQTAGDDLFWYGHMDATAGSATFAKVPKTGGEVTRLTEESLNTNNLFAVSERHVYWSDGYSIRRLSTSGGTSEELAASVDGYHVLFADGHVYWFDTAGQLLRRAE